MKVSIVLPCYCERRNLEWLIPEIEENLREFEYEILVVDDDSPDATDDLIMGMSKANPRIKLVVRKANKGFAFSIREGIEKAEGDAIIVMDSDGNHRPSYLPFMISNLAFYDCIVASRFQYGGAMYPRSRHVLSWLFNIFTRFMTQGNITDNLYGYFAVKKSFLMKIDFPQVFWGYGDYCIRLLLYLQKMKLSILQFPAVNGSRKFGDGQSNFFKVFIKYFIAVIRLTYNVRFKKCLK